MPQPMTLSIIGGLTVLGAASGVALGHSAISEINPAYFSEAAARFHGDQVPNRSTDWAQVQSAEYVGPADSAALGTGCFGCSAPGAYISAPPPAPSYTDAWLADSARAVEAVEAEVIYEAPDPERERLVRYASYPVSGEEAEAAIAAAEAEPAPAPTPEAEVAAGTVGL